MVHNRGFELISGFCRMVRGVLMLDVINIICGLVALISIWNIIVSSGLSALIANALGGKKNDR